MTLTLPTFDGSNLQFILDLIAQEFPLQSQDLANGSVTSDQLATGIVLELNTTGTTRKVAFGTGTVTFSAANASSSTFAHGMSGTPVFAIAGTRSGGTLVNNFYGYIADVGGTNLQVNAEYKADTATTFSGTWNFYWLAIA